MKNKKIVMMILILSVSLLTALYTVVDNDYFWHISAGKYMISHRLILTRDVFSWIVAGKIWISHEWLFEIIIYILKYIFGNYHILIYITLNIFILLVILFFHNKDNYKKNRVFTLIWLMFYLIINISLLSPRPQLISSWLIALTLYFLYDLEKNENSKKIYFMPFIALFWTNVHGGSSSLSYLLIILFLIAGLFSINIKYIKSNRLSKKQKKKYILVLFLTIFALTLNPHGIKMLIYPYENIINKTMQKNITEWRMTDLKTGYHYLYYLFIFFLLGIMKKSKKQVRVIDLLLIIVFTYMGIRSVRFWNYIYIGASFFIFYYIKERKDDKKTNELFLFISIALITIFLINLDPVTKKMNNTKYLSDSMIEKIKEEKPKRLFNLYDHGGYLIDKEIKVFIDGRADLYTDYNYQDYLAISNKKNNVEELIKKYRFDYLLVNNQFNISKYLKNNPKYTIVFQDQYSILYKKKDT